MLDSKIHEFGTQILKQSESSGQNILSFNFWTSKLMAWSMKNERFKVQLFRFVDVLPVLKNPKKTLALLREYIIDEGDDVPLWFKVLYRIAEFILPASVLAKFVKLNIEMTARTFIVGSNSKEASAKLESLWNSGYSFTVDILGEAVLSEEESMDYRTRYLELISGLSKQSKNWKANELCEKGAWGEIPRVNVSVKCSALVPLLDPLNYEGSLRLLEERLVPLLREAKSKGCFVNLDMEQNELRPLFMDMAERVFCSDEFASYPHFGIVIQAYLKSANSDLERIKEWVQKRAGTPLTVRLVKGAYWDFESIKSAQMGWDLPVWAKKAQSDLNYEKCAELMLKAYPAIRPAFGSHNVRSISAALCMAEELNVPRSAVEIQMLYGMANSIKSVLIKNGVRLREYTPVGGLLPGMAYLVRRLLENTSNEGFLRAQASGMSYQSLLENPSNKLKLITQN